MRDLLKTSPKPESFVDTRRAGNRGGCESAAAGVKVRMEERPNHRLLPQPEICVLRNGKARKNDPPIPQIWPPSPEKASGPKRPWQRQSRLCIWTPSASATAPTTLWREEQPRGGSAPPQERERKFEDAPKPPSRGLPEEPGPRLAGKPEVQTPAAVPCRGDSHPQSPAPKSPIPPSPGWKSSWTSSMPCRTPPTSPTATAAAVLPTPKRSQEGSVPTEPQGE